MTPEEMNRLIAERTGIVKVVAWDDGDHCEIRTVPDFATEPWNGRLLQHAWENRCDVKYQHGGKNAFVVTILAPDGAFQYWDHDPDHRIAFRNAFAKMVKGENK